MEVSTGYVVSMSISCGVECDVWNHERDHIAKIVNLLVCTDQRACCLQLLRSSFCSHVEQLAEVQH